MDKKEATQIFRTACAKGDIDTLRHYLTNPELAALTGYENGRGVEIACANRQLEVIKYLVTSPEVPVKAVSVGAWESMIQRQQFDILEWFILDYKMRRNGTFDEVLFECSNEDTKQKIEQMFTLRELNKNLNTQLTPKATSVNKIKI